MTKTSNCKNTINATIAINIILTTHVHSQVLSHSQKVVIKKIQYNWFGFDLHVLDQIYTISEIKDNCHQFSLLMFFSFINDYREYKSSQVLNLFT